MSFRVEDGGGTEIATIAKSVAFLDAIGLHGQAGFSVDKSDASFPLERGEDVYIRDTTNQTTYSQDFDNAAWVKTGGSITANDLSDPDSGAEADTFTEDTSTGYHALTHAKWYGDTEKTVFIWSAHLKYIDRQWIYLQVNDGIGTHTAKVWFDIQNGTIGNKTVSGTPEIVATGMQDKGGGCIGAGWRTGIHRDRQRINTRKYKARPATAI